MTYKEAEEKVNKYSFLIGRSIDPINNDCEYTIHVLLIAPIGEIGRVFDSWWYNNNDNKLALLQLKNGFNANELEVFACGYNGDGNMPYYILDKYLEKANLT